MNHTEQANLAQGKAKDGSELEFGFQFWDFNKAALVMSIGKAKGANVKDKITAAYGDSELENSYHFFSIRGKT